MRHYRLIVLLAVLAAALSLPVAGSTAPIDQVKGPACGDITLWDPDQAGPPIYTTHLTGVATVYALLTTAKPSCSSMTYTISVYADANGTTLLNSQTFQGDGTSSSFSYSFSPAGAPNPVCISAVSIRDGHVVDAAPNSGCFPLFLDTSGGQSGIN